MKAADSKSKILTNQQMIQNITENEQRILVNEFELTQLREKIEALENIN